MTLTSTDPRIDWGHSVAGAIDGMSLVHTRAFEDAAIEQHDGRLTGRLVPYDSPAMVVDMLPNGQPDIYREGFRRGAFERLLRDPKGNAGRLEIKHRHNGGLGYLGPGVELDDRDDGLYGTFFIISERRNSVAELLDKGHRGLSIEFREAVDGTVREAADGTVRESKDDWEEDDIRWRTKVNLSGVALEWQGAYSEAQVLAFRSEIEAEHADELSAAEAAQAQAEVEAAEAAAVQAAVDEAAARQRRQAEVDDWLAEQESRQAELAAKYR